MPGDQVPLQLGTVRAYAARVPWQADVVVDVANVCRDSSLGGPGTDLHRLEMVVAAWARHTGVPCPRLLLHADRSMLDPLQRDLRMSDQDARRLQEWEGAGAVFLHTSADEPLLQAAAVAGLPVLSSDYFVEHRRHHPWIDGSTDRFFHVRRQADGGLVVEARDMGRPTDASASAAVEEHELASRHLLRPGRLSRSVAVLWRCTGSTCELAGGGAFSELPLLHRGKVRCPRCKGPVEEAGPRPVLLQVRVRHGEREVDRLSLRPGVSELGGSRPLKGLPRRPLLEVRVVAVGTEPVAVRGDLLEVSVRPLSPDPAVALVRRREDRTWAEPEAVGPGEEVVLGPRDQLRIEGGVVLERCGRQFPVVEVMTEDEG